MILIGYSKVFLLHPQLPLSTTVMARRTSWRKC